MLPPYACDPSDPCCTALYDTASEILLVAQTALATCSANCGEIAGFVTVGPFISRPSNDYIAVWLGSLRPVGRTDVRGAPLLASQAVATYNFKLMETGWPWPSANEGTIELPPPEVVHQAASHSIGHAEAILRAIVNSAVQKDFGCGFHSWVDLTPVQPSGGMAGWTGGVVVDVEW